MIHRARLILTRIWRWRGRTHAMELARKRDIQGFFVKYIWVICVSSLRVCLKQEDGSVDVGEVADLNQLDHLQDFDQLVLSGNDNLNMLKEKIFCRLFALFLFK